MQQIQKTKMVIFVLRSLADEVIADVAQEVVAATRGDQEDIVKQPDNDQKGGQ